MAKDGSGLEALWRRVRGAVELPLLLGFLGVALLLLGFAQIADEMSEGELDALDRAILLAFRNTPDDPIGAPAFEGAMRDLTALGSYTVLGCMVAAVIAYLAMAGLRRMALLLTASIAGGMVLSNVLKFSFTRPRPDIVAPLVEVYTSSFPSGHATLAAVTYLTLGALLAEVHPRRRLKLYFLGLGAALTIMVGLSRIYLGVHYPSDVLAGWCVGAAWALFCYLVTMWIRRPRPQAKAG